VPCRAIPITNLRVDRGHELGPSYLVQGGRALAADQALSNDGDA